MVMYLGRGDFGPEDLLDRYVQMSSTFPSPDWVVQQVLEKVPLAQYLQDAMQELRRRNININNFLAT
jgi:hypothetical protein